MPLNLLQDRLFRVYGGLLLLFGVFEVCLSLLSGFLGGLDFLFGFSKFFKFLRFNQSILSCLLLLCFLVSLLLKSFLLFFLLFFFFLEPGRKGVGRVLRSFRLFFCGFVGSCSCCFFLLLLSKQFSFPSLSLGLVFGSLFSFCLGFGFESCSLSFKSLSHGLLHGCFHSIGLSSFSLSNCSGLSGLLIRCGLPLGLFSGSSLSSLCGLENLGRGLSFNPLFFLLPFELRQFFVMLCLL